MNQNVDYEHGPACHGYACGCVCARCRDRSERAVHMRREGLPNAASEALYQSVDYFKQPWRYRQPDDPTVPPQPFTGETCQTGPGSASDTRSRLRS